MSCPEEVLREIEECIDYIRDGNFVKIPFWGSVALTLRAARDVLKEQDSAKERCEDNPKQRMDDFKKPLIETIQSSNADHPVELMNQLVSILYFQGYRDGEKYMVAAHGNNNEEESVTTDGIELLKLARDKINETGNKKLRIKYGYNKREEDGYPGWMDYCKGIRDACWTIDDIIAELSKGEKENV